MALPWLRFFDTVIGVADFALGLRSERRPALSNDTGGRALGGLETRLAGVVVAALKEAFDRDTRRLDFERQQLDAERRRAERALRMEWLRQTGDRELGRLRLVAGVAAACWIATLVLSVQLRGGPLAARVVLALGWGFLLGAIAAAFAGQASVGRALGALDPDRDSPMHPTVAGLMAPWFVVLGLALACLAMLLV